MTPMSVTHVGPSSPDGAYRTTIWLLKLVDINVQRSNEINVSAELVREDEEHVFFSCPLYTNIRTEHLNIFNTSSSVKSILNPSNTDILYETATVLFEIEKTHKKFNM